MARVCVRPGCDRVARARLSYDVVGCQVWLDPLTDRAGSAPEICDLHTDRLTVPRGWMLCDRRGDAPALFVPTAAETSEERTAVTGPRVASDLAVASAPTGRPGRRRRARLPGSDRSDLVLFRHDHESPSPARSDAPGPQVRPELPVDSELPVGSEPLASPEHVAAPAATRPAAAGPAAAGPAIAASSAQAVEPEPSTGSEVETPEEEDELESMRATSPLLARAFSTTGPQRSVLTQFLEDNGN